MEMRPYTKVICAELGIKPFEIKAIKTSRVNPRHNRQYEMRVITNEDELIAKLNEDWNFVKELSSKRL